MSNHHINLAGPLVGPICWPQQMLMTTYWKHTIVSRSTPSRTIFPQINVMIRCLKQVLHLFRHEEKRFEKKLILKADRVYWETLSSHSTWIAFSVVWGPASWTITVLHGPLWKNKYCSFKDNFTMKWYCPKNQEGFHGHSSQALQMPKTVVVTEYTFNGKHTKTCSEMQLA